MAEEITGGGIETGGGSLIDVKVDTTGGEDIVEKPEDIVEKPEDIVEKPEDIEEKPEDDEKVSVNVEETIEKFGDLMEEGQLNTILGDFNEGKITGKDLITKILNEVGIAKDELEKKIDGEIETVQKSLQDNPVEGIDLADLGGWVSKQGEEMVKYASILTDFSLGEEAVRASIALLNKIRMGKGGVGDPEIKPVVKATISKDTLREEYMAIYQTKKGMERVLGIENLVKKAEKTGDKELLQWAVSMFN